jgi:hypothetical protein
MLCYTAVRLQPGRGGSLLDFGRDDLSCALILLPVIIVIGGFLPIPTWLLLLFWLTAAVFSLANAARRSPTYTLA